MNQKLISALLYLGLPIVGALLMIIPSIRSTVSPFLFGFIAALILAPVVRWTTVVTRLPKTIVILGIFVIFAILATMSISRSIRLINQESVQLVEETQEFTKMVKQNTYNLPDYVSEMTIDLINSTQQTLKAKQKEPISLVRGALGRSFSVLIFLMATFYFLKDEELFDRFLKQTSLGKSLGETINNYFRGQIILIFIMTILTFIFLSVMHIKFALLLSIFTGIMELVPLVGPVAASTVAAAVVFFTQATSYGQPTLIVAIIIIIGFGAIRQFEDFFVIPYVMGRSTRLPPLFIIFFTLLGERLYGASGLFLAVPFAATYKVIIEHVKQKYFNDVKS